MTWQTHFVGGIATLSLLALIPLDRNYANVGVLAAVPETAIDGIAHAGYVQGIDDEDRGLPRDDLAHVAGNIPAATEPLEEPDRAGIHPAGRLADQTARPQEVGLHG